MSDMMDINQIWLSGKMEGPPKFSHEHRGEAYYQATIMVPRLSGQVDHLPVTLSGRLLVNPLRDQMLIAVQGQLRSYNRYINGAHRLLLSVYAQRLCEQGTEQGGNTVNDSGIQDQCNEIRLSGTLCKSPVYRRTPLGREIADLLISSARNTIKSDYIPCIAWGRDAQALENQQAGQRISIVGRLQSREYQKQLPDGSIETRLAYEVSVTRLEK